MDQFNKVLAVFLLLVVAVGLSLFIFSRLGILSKILPSSKLVSPTITTKITQSLTPTQTTIPPTNKPEILGWLSQLGKPKATFTPSPTPNPKLQSPNPTTAKKPDKAQTQTPTPIATNSTHQTTTPNITIIPYGSTSISTYPESGIETMFIPLTLLITFTGIYLRQKAS